MAHPARASASCRSWGASPTPEQRRHPDDRRIVDRPTSTFKPRRRGLSVAQRGRMDRHLEQWGLDEDGPRLEPGVVFPDCEAVVLDIGTGDGEAVLAFAERAPNVGVIAVEVHTPGVASTLDGIAVRALTNVRVVHGDVLVFLGRLPAGSLAGVRALFPDPWPKQRQRHRRLLRADVLDVLVDRLADGGWIEVATDAPHVADEVVAWAEVTPGVVGGVVDRADRPVTRFEQRALAEGRVVIDLRFRRQRGNGVPPSDR